MNSKENIDYDICAVRKDFPILSSNIYGKPLVYLDNAASSQKPKSVLSKEYEFLTQKYGNIKRSAHKLAMDASKEYENARKKVADFLGVENEKEIIFTSGTTQSINLVSHSFGKRFIKSGDEVIISEIEHHSNIVPWQVLCEEKGVELKIIPVNAHGELMIDEFEKLINKKTKMVAITHVSNALGTITPVRKITDMAHAVGAKVLVDGAQSVPHMKIDIKDLGCDFFAFSGHKVFGPTGIGVLFGKSELLNEMPPYVTGGGMIMNVTFEKTSFASPPSKFEAGTPPISQAVGLGAAIDYINSIGLDKIKHYEEELLEYGTKLLSLISGLRIIGTAKKKTSILSFYMDSAHPHDILTFLDQDGIAVRGGHHCAQPTMKRFNIPATARASLALYNTKEELDKLAESIEKVKKFFG